MKQNATGGWANNAQKNSKASANQGYNKYGSYNSKTGEFYSVAGNKTNPKKSQVSYSASYGNIHVNANKDGSFDGPMGHYYWPKLTQEQVRSLLSWTPFFPLVIGADAYDLYKAFKAGEISGEEIAFDVFLELLLEGKFKYKGPKNEKKFSPPESRVHKDSLGINSSFLSPDMGIPLPIPGFMNSFGDSFGGFNNKNKGSSNNKNSNNKSSNNKNSNNKSSNNKNSNSKSSNNKNSNNKSSNNKNSNNKSSNDKSNNKGSNDKSSNNNNNSNDNNSSNNNKPNNNNKLNREEIKDLLENEVSTKVRDILANQSKKGAGPCLSGIYDPETGKLAFGQNFRTNKTGREEYKKWIENDADPLIMDLVSEYERKINNGEVILEEFVDNRYAAHSEIVALDQILKFRRELGLPVDKSTLSKLYLENIDLKIAFKTGEIVSKDRCQHCRNLTGEINMFNHN